MLLLLLSGYRFAAGQNTGDFQYVSPLPDIAQEGFYRILLTPAHTSRMQAQLADARILTADATEVPYLADSEAQELHYTRYRAYEIIEEQRIPGQHSVYIVHNPEKKAINNLTLIIKNAAVKKEIKLLGSEDLQEWFAVKEQSILASVNNPSGTSEIKLLDFPLSDYAYFKLQIQDSVSAPIQITSIGYYEHFSESGHYQEIPAVTTRQLESKAEKLSIIELSFPRQQLLDRLELEIAGPSFYHRQARLEAEVSYANKPYFELIETFILSSATPHVLTLPALRTGRLRIIIENGDNPPLQLKARAWQLNRYLVAYLQQGETYTLQFGNRSLDAPAYDLHYFRDSIPPTAAVLETGGIKEIPAKVVSQPVSKSIFGTTLYIWLAIIAVACLLGYVTYRMVNEMEQKQQ